MPVFDFSNSGRELFGCILMFAAIVLVQLPDFQKKASVS